MKTFICSDLHLGHKRVLIYEPCRLRAVYDKYYSEDSKFTCFEQFQEFYKICCDSYNTAWEMKAAVDIILQKHDDLIIENWNSVVSKDDLVWFLGDFALGGATKYEAYKKRLNGRIKMIMGNHDTKPASYYYKLGFSFVSRHPILLGQNIILSHEPVENLEGSKFFNYFGHVHSQADIPTVTENGQCVCIERQELKPIEIEF